MSNSKDFNGKVVIITGSSSGIGAKAAEDFVKYGAQVVITGRNEKNLSEVGQKCLKASPKLKPLEVVADVSKEEDCKRLIDSTIKAFGRLDILVNNAGAGNIVEVEDSEFLKKFDNMINVNLRSVVCLTHLSVKYLEKTKGNIINISSTAGLKPHLGMSLYGTAKCGLDFFTKCAALELGPKGIRVNVINPAAVRTNFFTVWDAPKGLGEKFFEFMEPNFPIGRSGITQDVSNSILFLASDECFWVTGINFVCDGGLLNAPIPSS